MNPQAPSHHGPHMTPLNGGMSLSSHPNAPGHGSHAPAKLPSNVIPLPQNSAQAFPQEFLGAFTKKLDANKQLLKEPLKEREEQLSEDISSLIPDSRLFHKLVALENKIDSSLKKKYLQLQDVLPEANRKTQMVPKVLRLCVYNVYDNQNAFYHTEDSQLAHHEPPSWTLRVEGRLADEAHVKPKNKFSHYIKKMFIQLDPNEYPDSWSFEWHKSMAVEETDGFEIKRIGQTETNVTIFIQLDHTDKFQITPALAAALQTPVHLLYTKQMVLKRLWSYIKVNRLFDPSQKSAIRFNERLRSLFNIERAEFHDLPRLLSHHMVPPNIIQISHTIRLSGDPMENEQWFELNVDVDVGGNNDKLVEELRQKDKATLEKLDTDIQQAIARVNSKKRKRDFFVDFANDPLTFIEDFIMSQTQDYKLVQNLGLIDPEYEKTTEFYMQPLSNQAVNNYLDNQMTRIIQEDIPTTIVDP